MASSAEELIRYVMTASSGCAACRAPNEPHSQLPSSSSSSDEDEKWKLRLTVVALQARLAAAEASEADRLAALALAAEARGEAEALARLLALAQAEAEWCRAAAGAREESLASQVAELKRASEAEARALAARVGELEKEAEVLRKVSRPGPGHGKSRDQPLPPPPQVSLSELSSVFADASRDRALEGGWQPESDQILFGGTQAKPSSSEAESFAKMARLAEASHAYLNAPSRLAWGSGRKTKLPAAADKFKGKACT